MTQISSAAAVRLSPAQQRLLARIAQDQLVDGGRGEAHVSPPAKDRTTARLVEIGLIAVREYRERTQFGIFTGTLAELTDLGWSRLGGLPLPDQLRVLEHRQWWCDRTWCVYRSCLARGWVEEIDGGQRPGHPTAQLPPHAGRSSGPESSDETA